MTISQLTTLHCIVWNQTRGYQSKMPKRVRGLLQYSNNEAWRVAVEKGTQKGLGMPDFGLRDSCVLILQQLKLFDQHSWTISNSVFCHYSSLTAPNLQRTANQGMYNFIFTILINTNNTSNYQSANETHYTQHNTTITTYKGSQLLISIETRYQLQPSNKVLHTEHTPLN